MISITLITTIMAALGLFFVTVVQSVNHQRQQQVAAQLVNTALDNARSIGAAHAVAGRDANSVTNQLKSSYLGGLSTCQKPPLGQCDATSKVYQNYLSTWNPAIDTTAASNAGLSAALPTQADTRTVNGQLYNISYFVGICYRGGTDLTGNCLDVAPGAAPTNSVQYVRIVVDVSWTTLHCPSFGCESVSSTLLNGRSDPLFNFNQAPPPTPTINTPPSQFSDLGSPVNGMKITSPPCTPSPETPCRISASGGVPPYVFVAQGMPSGLAMDGTGLVTGTPTVTGGFTVTITVTDAFLSQKATGAFSWHIYSQIATPDVSNQASVKSQSVGTLNLGAATGGSGASNLSWSDPNSTLPDGLSITTCGGSSANLCITGTPTTINTYQVKLRVTDSASGSTQTISFQWAIGSVVIVPPASQIGTLNNELDLTFTAKGGTSPYTWSIVSTTPSAGFAPTINSGTGALSGTPTATGAYTIIVQVTDKNGLSTQTTVSLNVYDAPSIVGPGDGSAGSLTQITTEGLTPQLPFSYTCPSKACTLSVSAVNNATGTSDTPAWLTWSPATVNSTSGGATLGNAPATTVGKWTVTASITQGTGATVDTENAANPFVLDVRDAPKFTTGPADQSGPPGVETDLPAVAYCDNNPSGTPAGTCASYTLKIGGAAPAPWFTYDTTSHRIEVTPPAGTYARYQDVTLTATDAAGVDIVSTSFTWTVDTPPTLAIPDQTTWAGATTTVSMDPSWYTCSGGGCNFTLGSSAPSWMSIASPSTGAITVTNPPMTATSVSVPVVITDKWGETNPGSFTWNFRDVITPPTINTTQKTYLAYPIQFDCHSTTNCKITASNLPAGLSLTANSSTNATSAYISGVASSSATTATNVVITVVDGPSGSQTTWTSAPFTVTVNSALVATQPVQWFNATRSQCAYYSGGVKPATSCYPSPLTSAYQFEFSSPTGGTITVLGAPTTVQCLKSSNTAGGAVTLVSCSTGSPTTNWVINTTTTTSGGITKSAGSITTTSGSNTYELVLTTGGALQMLQLTTTTTGTGRETATSNIWGLWW